MSYSILYWTSPTGHARRRVVRRIQWDVRRRQPARADRALPRESGAVRGNARLVTTVVSGSGLVGDFGWIRHPAAAPHGGGGRPRRRRRRVRNRRHDHDQVRPRAQCLADDDRSIPTRHELRRFAVHGLRAAGVGVRRAVDARRRSGSRLTTAGCAADDQRDADADDARAHPPQGAARAPPTAPPPPKIVEMPLTGSTGHHLRPRLLEVMASSEMNNDEAFSNLDKITLSFDIATHIASTGAGRDRPRRGVDALFDFEYYSSSTGSKTEAVAGKPRRGPGGPTTRPLRSRSSTSTKQGGRLRRPPVNTDAEGGRPARRQRRLQGRVVTPARVIDEAALARAAVGKVDGVRAAEGQLGRADVRRPRSSRSVSTARMTTRCRRPALADASIDRWTNRGANARLGAAALRAGGVRRLLLRLHARDWRRLLRRVHRRLDVCDHDRRGQPRLGRDWRRQRSASP